MNITSIFLAIKALDAIHDYLLCPLFGQKDNQKQELEKIHNKLTELETLILTMKDKAK